MFSPRGPYWFFLNSSCRRSPSGCSPASAFTPVRYCLKRNAPCHAVDPEMPEPEFMPARLGVAQNGDRAVRDHGELLHVVGEGVDLHAIDLVTREGSAQGVNAYVLGLNVASGFVDLPIQLCGFDL